MKYFGAIILSGIDKCGKDTICKELNKRDRSLIVHSRGLLDNLAYDKIFNRDNTYPLKPHHREFFVYLTVDKETWIKRCLETNEPLIDYDQHRAVFDSVYKNFSAVFNTMTLDTSNSTVKELCDKILERFNDFESRLAEEAYDTF